MDIGVLGIAIRHTLGAQAETLTQPAPTSPVPDCAEMGTLPAPANGDIATTMSSVEQSKQFVMPAASIDISLVLEGTRSQTTPAEASPAHPFPHKVSPKGKLQPQEEDDDQELDKEQAGAQKRALATSSNSSMKVEDQGLDIIPPAKKSHTHCLPSMFPLSAPLKG